MYSRQYKCKSCGYWTYDLQRGYCFKCWREIQEGSRKPDDGEVESNEQH